MLGRFTDRESDDFGGYYKVLSYMKNTIVSVVLSGSTMLCFGCHDMATRSIGRVP